MSLGVAVRANQNAFVELGDYLLPGSVNPIDGQREGLLRCVEVVELECSGHVVATTAHAAAAQGQYRPALCLATQLDDSMAARGGFSRMADAMAVSADEIALGSFFSQTRETAAEFAEHKLLRRGVTMVELKSFERVRVATIDAPPTELRDQLALSRATSLRERSPELLATALLPGPPALFAGADPQRELRGVVLAEGRALETERSAIERSDLALDDLLRWKLATAGLADQTLDVVRDGLPGPTERSMRSAVETMLATPQIKPDTVDQHVGRKFAAAVDASLHIADGT